MWAETDAQEEERLLDEVNKALEGQPQERDSTVQTPVSSPGSTKVCPNFISHFLRDGIIIKTNLISDRIATTFTGSRL